MSWVVLGVALAVLAVSVVVMVKVLLALDDLKETAVLAAEKFASAQHEHDRVAEALAQSRVRADEATGPHGDAGDAAARSGSDG